VIAPAVAELAGHTSTKQACELVGWSRATHYRARRPAEPAPVGPRPAPPNALSPAECARVLAELNSRRFVDKSVGQCWATLLDEGTYLCSMSTMHRLLRRAGQAGERRHQATHPARVNRSCWPPRPSRCGLRTSPNSAGRPAASTTTCT
jgi:putative transposase